MVFKFLVFFAAVIAAQTLTEPTECTQLGDYTLCQNLWGRDSGTGSQTTTPINASDDAVSWSTDWNWQGGENAVKSYANVEANKAKGMRLSAISAVPSTWEWEYQTTGSDLRADIAYDIWTGNDQDGGTPASNASAYEIMIWLSRQGGVQPIGSQIASAIPLAGYTWDLWSGPNQNWEVLSFVPASGDIPSFAADLLEFFEYLIANQGVPASQFLQHVQAGTEPFTGSADLVTTKYSVSVTKKPEGCSKSARRRRSSR